MLNEVQQGGDEGAEFVVSDAGEVDVREVHGAGGEMPDAVAWVRQSVRSTAAHDSHRPGFLRRYGRGRVFDNIFTERLWRTVKYEEVYLDGLDAHGQLTKYFRFYNERRLHQALGYQTPREVHFGGAASEAVRIKTPSHEARQEGS